MLQYFMVIIAIISIGFNINSSCNYNFYIYLPLLLKIFIDFYFRLWYDTDMKAMSFERSIRNDEWAMTNLHSHTFYEIYFLIKGSRSIVFEHNKVNLTPGSFLIVPPFIPHLTEGGAFERINIFFSPEYIDKMFQTDPLFNNTGAYTIDSNSYKIISTLLDSATNIKTKNSLNNFISNDATISACFLNTILWHIKNGKLSPISIDLNTKKDKKDKEIIKIVEYINNNPNKKITLELLCEMFFFTKSNLYKRFHKFMAMPVGEYILFTKLNHAKKLLHSTNKNLEEISYECGFSSQNYFSLIFKKKLGISPRDFRHLK